MRPYVPLADAIIGDGWDALNFEQALGHPLVEITGGVDAELFRPVPPDPELRLGLPVSECCSTSDGSCRSRTCRC